MEVIRESWGHFENPLFGEKKKRKTACAGDTAPDGASPVTVI